MLLMATSLAFTAGRIMFSYLLTHSQPVAGKTMNAVLLTNVFGRWPGGTAVIIVVMYSINVFITFSLSLLGMSKHFIQDRAKEPKWHSRLLIHGVGFLMCASILVVTVFEKFAYGGWITIAITAVLVLIAFSI